MKNIYLQFEKLKSYLFLVSQKEVSESDDSKTIFVPYLFFVGVIVFYITFMLAKQPNWVLGGEMWAEMATNYFSNASSSSYYVKFFATDAGYVPFPQRVIAYIGNIVSLPATIIPYFYTWAAIIVTAMMVGSFSLPIFRKLIENDLLRFLASISILIVVDFETRTFINFTYFVAFFGAIITALSLVQTNSEKVPSWAWLLPFLLVSKPAALSVFPIMLIAAISSNNRFRLISLVTLIFVALQLLQLSISLGAGAFQHAQSNEITILIKLLATIKYFFGFLGGYIFGPDMGFDKNTKLIAGIIVFFILTILLFKARFKNNALVLVGLSLIFSNVLLNSFTLPSVWTIEINNLNGLPLYRHVIVAYSGVILVVVGLITHIENLRFTTKNNLLQNMSIFIFLLWFISTGWMKLGLGISKEPSSPTLDNSHWQTLSSLVDSPEQTVCVQINPIQWVYGRNCKVINQGLVWGTNQFKKVDKKLITFELEKIKQQKIKELNIQSFSILIKPNSYRKTFIEAVAVLKTTDGRNFEFFGQANILPSGGTLLFTTSKLLLVKNVSKIKIIFNSQVEIAVKENTPAILWMGKIE